MGRVIMAIKHPRSSSIIAMVFLFLNTSNAAENTYEAPRLCNGIQYTKASKFESNLNTVLNDLVNNTWTSGGFYTSVSGQRPDKIYGLLQCRGDATHEECHKCSQEANTRAREDCGNVIGVKIWLVKCFIHYENFSFFGLYDIGYKYLDDERKATDPEVFSTAVKGLLKNLSDTAYQSPSRYSSGYTKINSSIFDKIFGLVQCWKDLFFVNDCSTCLTTAIAGLLNRTGNGTQVGGVALMGSCTARYETYQFFNLDSPTPSYPPQIQQAPSSKKSSNKIAIILGSLGGLLGMLLLIFVLAIGRKAFENRDIEENPFISEDQQIIFKLENLKAATNNFDDANKLGQGGFGPVYKGTMQDGKEIAVKKLSLDSLQGKKEFLNEIKFLAKIQHRNLVNILGWCTQGSELLLVYEFLANKSLDKLLFNSQGRKGLDWQKRLNIIFGIARGLLYLHEDSRICIIHRDIKAGNILLDEKMVPKISDFGLAKLFPQDETHVNTTVVAGTRGYMAPEYAMRGQLSVKVDVYSFGVVLLEIVCGRKNTEFENFLELVWRSYNGENVVDVIDKTIIESCPHEQVSRCIQVGLLCTQADASIRPPMSNVYRMLLDTSMTNLPKPKNPGFVSDVSSAAPLTLRPSVNDASITDLEAR